MNVKFTNVEPDEIHIVNEMMMVAAKYGKIVSDGEDQLFNRTVIEHEAKYI